MGLGLSNAVFSRNTNHAEPIIVMQEQRVQVSKSVGPGRIVSTQYQQQQSSPCPSNTWNIEKISGLLTMLSRTYNLKRTAPPSIRSYHMSNTHSPKYKMLKHKYQCSCLKVTLDFCTVKQSNVQGFFKANWSYLKLETKRGPQLNNNHFEV
jgi:hypothetical protein